MAVELPLAAFVADSGVLATVAARGLVAVVRTTGRGVAVARTTGVTSAVTSSSASATAAVLPVLGEALGLGDAAAVADGEALVVVTEVDAAEALGASGEAAGMADGDAFDVTT